MKNTNAELFLKELTLLSKKYKIYIGGCGCCGSPYLSRMGDEELNGKYTVSEDDLMPYDCDNLEWDLEDNND